MAATALQQHIDSRQLLVLPQEAGMFSDQRRSTRRHCILAVVGGIAVAVALAATVPPLAKAESFHTTNLRAISGPSPFAAGWP